jgi:hypothetical protein
MPYSCGAFYRKAIGFPAAEKNPAVYAVPPGPGRFEGLCSIGIILRARVSCHLQIVAAAGTPRGRYRRSGKESAAGFALEEGKRG